MAIKVTKEDLDFMDHATRDVEKPTSQTGEVSGIRSFLNTLGRGAVKGIRGFGRAMGPLIPQTGEEYEAQQRFPEQVEEFFPTQGMPYEKAIERGLEMFPFAVGGGAPVGGTESLLRSLLAGGLGQAAEELEFGPVGQTVAELAAFAAPSLSKKIPSKPGEEALRAFAKEAGITERELPIVLEESNKARRFAAKASRPGSKTKDILDFTREKLGGAWKTLEDSPEAVKNLNPRAKRKFTEQMTKQLEDLPSDLRTKINSDYNDLLKSDFKGNNLINFWQDLNHYIGKGDTKLGILKEPLKNAIESISPELRKDFQLMNTLYKNFAEHNKLMKPKTFEELFLLGEAGSLITGMALGNPAIIYSVLGTAAGRELARELVINPRLQRMTKRFANALNKGKIPAAKQIYEKLVPMVSEKNDEAAKKLAEIDVADFYKLVI